MSEQQGRPQGGGSPPAYLEPLNPRQREAVLHTGHPLLILAGAGSGKTRVITTKIAYLIDQRGLDPRSILAVAFTNKAADEMRERVRSLTAPGGEVMIKTFHAFGAWLLRMYGKDMGIPQGFSICDDEDSLALLKHIVQEQSEGGSPAPHRLKDLGAWIARAKDLCLLPGDDLSVLEGRAGIRGQDGPGIYDLYQRRLQQNGCLDFGDLLVRAVRLLEDSHELRERIRRRFEAILVDEYQDSNHAQFRLLQQLYDGSNYLCVVGDEDQSIYSFRGAELENMLSFADSFPGTEVIRLEENYRSTRSILEVASRVVENNRERLGKTLFTRQPPGGPVLLAYLEDPEEEALFCAERLKSGGFGDTAILYRMNFQSRVFESVFQRLGIPYRVVGTVRFYERQEIRDALAYLTLLVNPANELAFRRAIGKPRRGVGAKTLEAILKRREGGSVLEAAGKALPAASARTSSGLRAFLSLLESLRRSLSEGGEGSLSRVVKRLIMDSGLVDHYRERDRSDITGKVENLEELVNATAEYPASMEGLSRFLESLMLGGSEEDPFFRTKQVTLITAHNTKGLEFDRVFITGLEDGIFPHHSSTAGGLPVGGAELEEERRLFYVGATRARRELYLTACRKRRVFGMLRSSHPSRFLSEVPREYLQVYGPQPQAGDGYPLGCGVFHDDYGPGIVSRKWEVDGVAMVSVRFDSGKIARFPLKYSRLERISTDP